MDAQVALPTDPPFICSMTQSFLALAFQVSVVSTLLVFNVVTTSSLSFTGDELGLSTIVVSSSHMNAFNGSFSLSSSLQNALTTFEASSVPEIAPAHFLLLLLDENVLAHTQFSMVHLATLPAMLPMDRKMLVLSMWVRLL